MKFLKGTLGFMCVGLFVGGVWGEFAGKYGLAGGWMAAVIIIGPMWFMNHFVGIIPNESDAAFVDMGLGVGIACFMRDVFNNGISSGMDSLPTLLFVAVGAVIGGLVSAAIEKDMESKTKVEVSESQNIEN